MKKIIETFETPRQSIKHIEDLRPLEFVKFLNKFKDIEPADITFSEKIDGSGIRFGFFDGKFLIETSYSGLFEPGQYTKTIEAKYGYKPTDWSKLFDEFSYFLKSQTNLLNILRKYDGYKVVGEILYNPLNIDELGNLIKFVHIYYDKSKLGYICTCIPFTVLNKGITAPNSDKIINELLSISNNNFKIISPKVSLNVDFSVEIDSLNIFLKDYKDVETILTSRKYSLQQTKNTIIEYLNIIKRRLRDKILKNQEGLLGNDVEGYVLSIPGHNVKVTTDEFRGLLKK